MNNENLRIVLDEANEVLKNQQEGVILLYNKLNWILVTDVVLLAGLHSSNNENLLAVSSLLLSMLFTLVGFTPQSYKISAKISDQLEKVEHPKFLSSLIFKKKEALLANKKRIVGVHGIIDIAIGFLILSLLFIFFASYVQ